MNKSLIIAIEWTEDKNSVQEIVGTATLKVEAGGKAIKNQVIASIHGTNVHSLIEGEDFWRLVRSAIPDSMPIHTPGTAAP